VVAPIRTLPSGYLSATISQASTSGNLWISTLKQHEGNHEEKKETPLPSYAAFAGLVDLVRRS